MKPDPEFLAQMRAATQLLQSDGPLAATAAIQRALSGASAAGPASNADRPTRLQPAALLDAATVAADAFDTAPSGAANILARLRNRAGQAWTGLGAGQAIDDVDIAEETDAPGKFLDASCTNQAGTRKYKIYVPTGYRGQPLPLVIMLHGCKQNPTDFAAGTGMNMLAEQSNCFVVYPAQAHAANGSNCWNWFKRSDQQRDRGEPSIIADITRKVMREYQVDPGRVYVAGLSAGGAMAAIMGASYPELYAAIGIHSGLPRGAAHDVPSAFAAMKNGLPGTGPAAPCPASIPVIVFHGDRDTTVHPCNGDQALAQCVAGPGANPDGQGQPCAKVEKGQVPQGRRYTRSIRFDGAGKAIAEHWVVHGAGHAWSGGTRKGSYTDPQGPDAAQEMLRFFLTHTRAPSAG